MAFATKPKPKTNPVHKKRTGKHRTHNQQYLKHYWPYLPLLAIVAAGLLLNMLWPAHSAVLGASSDLSGTSLLRYTNQQRTADNESTLTLNKTLSAAAQSKALNMVADNYWSHNTPDGRTPWSFMSAAGYSYAMAGENLAYGFSDASQAVTAWMHSPEHRKNILNAGYSEVGFGVASSKDFVGSGPETVIVAMYAKPSALTIPAQPLSSDVPTAVKGATVSSLPVSRVALMAGSQAALISVLVVMASGLAVVIFVSRHARLLHRSLVRGEVFVQKHPLFDAAIVTIATAGVVLTHGAASIL